MTTTEHRWRSGEPEPPHPDGPTADALIQLVRTLDHDRKSGWARVAQLEGIILAYHRAITGVIDLLAHDLEPAVFNELVGTVSPAIDADPFDRDVWPPDIAEARAQCFRWRPREDRT